MSFKSNRRILNSSVYIVLGLVIIAVIAITVVTVLGMRKKTPPSPVVETPASQTSNTPAGIFDRTPSPTPYAPERTTPAPAGSSETATDGSASVTPSAGEVVRPVTEYRTPVDGAVMKEFSDGIPVRSLTMNDYRTHSGIDIAAPAGSAVCAVSDGKVLDVWSDPMMGVCLSIDHGGGLISLYKNLDTILPDGIVKGADVKAGQTVAAVGNTCLIELADADHLHFEMTYNGKHVDPGAYFSPGE